MSLRLSLYGFISDGDVYFYITDYQGNVREVTDIDGEVVQDAHYYPYGMLMAESSDILSVNRYGQSTIVTVNPYLFGCKEYLPFKGANYLDFTARHYDPAIAFFGTPDPLEHNTPSLHARMYCAANPINFIDPSGMKIKVAEEFQEMLLLDLQNVFGENSCIFTFDDNGLLNISDDLKGLSNDQIDIAKELKEIINEDLITEVYYGENLTIEIGEGLKKTFTSESGGGGFTILKDESNNKISQNYILVDPNVTITTVDAVTKNYYSKNRFSNGKANFYPIEVELNSTDILFHELGHVLYRNKTPDKVKVFNNKIRSILGLKPRPFDINHNKIGNIYDR